MIHTIKSCRRVSYIRSNIEVEQSCRHQKKQNLPYVTYITRLTILRQFDRNCLKVFRLLCYLWRNKTVIGHMLIIFGHQKVRQDVQKMGVLLSISAVDVIQSKSIYQKMKVGEKDKRLHMMH